MTTRVLPVYLLGTVVEDRAVLRQPVVRRSGLGMDKPAAADQELADGSARFGLELGFLETILDPPRQSLELRAALDHSEDVGGARKKLTISPVDVVEVELYERLGGLTADDCLDNMPVTVVVERVKVEMLQSHVARRGDAGRRRTVVPYVKCPEPRRRPRKLRIELRSTNR